MATPASGAGGAGGRQFNNDKTKRVQAEVDEVKGIMQNNVEKILQNHEQLDTLQGKTDNLATSAKQFQKSSNTLKKKMWWKNMKLNLIIATIVIAVLLVLILPFALKKK